MAGERTLPDPKGRFPEWRSWEGPTEACLDPTPMMQALGPQALGKVPLEASLPSRPGGRR